MRRVWLCDHCCETRETAEDMLFHEEECSFNPENRLCWSCGYRYNEFGVDNCGCEHPTDFDAHLDGEEPCPYWKSEDE